MSYKEQAIKFLRDKNKALEKNFQIDIFSLEKTGEYIKYKTDDNYFKALALSKGIDEVLNDIEKVKLIKNILEGESTDKLEKIKKVIDL